MTDHDSRNAIDALIGAFFSAFDNRHAAPELDRVVGCFTDKAVIASRSKGATIFYTPMEFALPRIGLLTQGTLRDFHEYETRSDTTIFDGIASRHSRYFKTGILDGKRFSGSGIKCFHIVTVEDTWRISSLVWVDDDT